MSKGAAEQAWFRKSARCLGESTGQEPRLTNIFFNNATSTIEKYKLEYLVAEKNRFSDPLQTVYWKCIDNKITIY